MTQQMHFVMKANGHENNRRISTVKLMQELMSAQIVMIFFLCTNL